MKHIKVYDTTWKEIIDNAPIAKPVIKAVLSKEPEKSETEMTTKKCPRCGKKLPLSEFGLNKTRKDGHQDYCKQCMRNLVNGKRKKKEQEDAVEEVKQKVLKNSNKSKPAPVAEPELVYVAPVAAPVPEKTLKSYTDAELCNELRVRGINILINPKPRDLMESLKRLGYTGTLEYYEKKTINLNANF